MKSTGRVWRRKG